jgi:transcriptional regulator with XRE-family HTH domain
VRTPTASQIIHDIGRRIGEVRAGRAWSQAKFAEKLGIAVQNVQRMEQGRQNFTVETLVRVARVLGCEPRDLWSTPTTRASTRGRPPSAPTQRSR